MPTRGEQRLHLSAVLTDFDGTMISSLGVLRSAYENFVSSHGNPTTFPTFDSVSHLSVPDCMRVCSDLGGLATPLSELTASYDEAVEKEIVHLPPRNGLVSFWKVLRRNDIRIAIVSSAPSGVIGRWLQRWKLQDYVSCITGREDVSEHKPDPAPYLHALEQLRVANSAAVAIEDSLTGAKSSLGAGIFTYLLADSTTTCSATLVHDYPQIRRRLGLK